MRNGMVDKNEPLRDLLTRGKKNGKFAAYDKFSFFLSFLFSKKKKHPLHLHWREKRVHVRSTNQMV